MLQQRTAIFLVNLIQDVNVLRPLMIMARRDFGFDVMILVAAKFRVRDLFGIWDAELQILRSETDATLLFYRTDQEAFAALKGSGIIFSASESSLPEHSATHAIFLHAPPTFLKVTLQHGFECVGFRHNAAHDRRYGTAVSFGADILCAWQPPELQLSMAASQRPKVQVTGPTAVLQAFTGPHEREPRGLVCENLHSVRMNSTSELKGEFVDSFERFCGLMAEEGREVALRPHPGGQFVLKNNVDLPPNAVINNAPMFRLDLRRFAYGISAPSSVLIDLLLADVPTAVWRHPDGGIDTSNYHGLTEVSDARQWREFALEASARPDPFVKLQRRFLADQQVPTDPSDVFARFARLFQAATRFKPRSGPAPVERERLLLVANSHLPTVRVCIEKPLQALTNSGEMVTELVTEKQLDGEARRLGSPEAVKHALRDALDDFAPDAVIFSRYSGPFGDDIVEWARGHAVPVIYHIDDDLLGVPRSLGEAKFAYHNAPARIAAVKSLLTGADLVYVSTEALRQRLLGTFPDLPAVTGPINASGSVLREPVEAPARVVGYMASADHLPNLEMVLPAIERLLDDHPQIQFETFGSIPLPASLERFGERVRRIEPVADYDLFLDRLARRRWDIGICPLVPTDFNRTKSNNKWVEYSSVGTAVVASAGMIYDDCCADGCGVLAADLDEWTAALERLVSDDALRVGMVRNAQAKLRSDFSVAQHRKQILDVVKLARTRAGSRRNEEYS